jgi:hypothetical protein
LPLRSILGVWLPTFGQARISEASSKPCSFIHASHEILSKRWIVDRATLYQARAQDLSYVNDPEHLDFLAIYFANGTLQNEILFSNNLISSSNNKTGQEAAI